jgi:hypothetical protein
MGAEKPLSDGAQDAWLTSSRHVEATLFVEQLGNRNSNSWLLERPIHLDDGSRLKHQIRIQDQ